MSSWPEAQTVFLKIYTSRLMITDALHTKTFLSVLVTRPKGQSEALGQLITAAGGQAFLQPVFNIEAIPSEELQPILSEPLQRWRWIIFISVNAVRYAARLAPDFLAGIQSASIPVAAIGEATAQELMKHGLTVSVLPANGSNSEALLQESAFHDLEGESVLIIRGRGGREHLADVLRSRGAEVAYAEVYQRAFLPSELFSDTMTLWREGSLDVAVVTSGEALTRLMELLDYYQVVQGRQLPLVVLSERIALIAKQKGWTSVWVAKTPSDESIFNELLELMSAMSEQNSNEPSQQNPIGEDESDPLKNMIAEPQPFNEPPEDVVQALQFNDPTTGDTALIQNETDLDPMPRDKGSADDTVPDLGVKEGTEITGSEPAIPPKKPKKSWMGYFLLIIILGLAGGGWFLLQKFRSNFQSLPFEKSREELGLAKQPETKPTTAAAAPAALPELAAMNAQIASLQTRLATDDSKIERILNEEGGRLNDRLETTRTELLNEIQDIRHQLTKTHGDILIADAEYLLSVANQKLNLVGDVKSVLAAMQAADQRLHESGDPAVFKVREALAEEMAVLRNASVPDFVGISSKLVYLEKMVSSLPLVLPHAGTIKEHEKEKQTVSQPQEKEAEPSGDAVDAAIKEIKGLITLRHTDRPIESILAPEQAEALRQVLILKLETTRAALLRNDEHLFKDSLTAARDWIGDHFDVSTDQARLVLGEIDGLLNSSLGVTYPDISKSMVLLQNIGKLRLETEDALLKRKPDVPKVVSPSVAPEPTPASEPGKSDAKGVAESAVKTAPSESKPEVSGAEPKSTAPAAKSVAPVEPQKPLESPASNGKKPEVESGERL